MECTDRTAVATFFAAELDTGDVSQPHDLALRARLEDDLRELLRRVTDRLSALGEQPVAHVGKQLLSE